MSALNDKIIEVARKYVGTVETGRNSGPVIDLWLHAVGARPGDPWCAAFAWGMLDEAARKLGLANPQRPTASVHWLWRTAHTRAKTGKPVPGSIFCIDHGGGKGHCGIVVGELPGKEPGIRTIEGNTNAAGEREGTMVRERERFQLEVNLGYLDFSQVAVDM